MSSEIRFVFFEGKIYEGLVVIVGYFDEWVFESFPKVLRFTYTYNVATLKLFINLFRNVSKFNHYSFKCQIFTMIKGHCLVQYILEINKR